MLQNEGGSSGTRRKWHTKSRTGCQVCRARKVKCDEQRPSCLNCIKKGAKCDFLQSAQSPNPITPNPSDSTLNLELLHHFTISTASTLSPDPQIRDLWRVVIPQIGFTTDYILDGILALAALHIARYSPARKDALLSYAVQHHSASLSKAMPLIPGVTTQNCSRLFVFSVLTLYFSLARPIQTNGSLPVTGVVPEWLYLFRGVDTVVMAESAILSSPVSLMFQSTWGSLDYWQTHAPEEYPALTELRERICARVTEGGEVGEKAKQSTLLAAIVALKRSYSFLYGRRFKEQDKLRGFYQWLNDLSDEYLALLKSADHEALCVLAFYSVLVKDLERYWWIEGWAVHLIRRIYMLLDGEHRLWVRWPIEEIGWVPETGAF